MKTSKVQNKKIIAEVERKRTKLPPGYSLDIVEIIYVLNTPDYNYGPYHSRTEAIIEANRLYDEANN